MKKTIIFLATALSLIACKKSSNVQDENPRPTVVTDINQIVAPPGFNYETAKESEIAITLLSNENLGLAGVRIDLMDKAAEDGGVILYTGSTNSFGKIIIKRELPLSLKRAGNKYRLHRVAK